MSDGKKYYCFCGSNCRYETMTKEQILAAIAQAVETGSVQDVDAGFVSKVKEANGARHVTFWVGTQAQYNALTSRVENCLYIITDDTKTADIERELTATKEAVKAIDITDKVVLTYPSDVYILEKEYKYQPSSNMVFFRLLIRSDNTAPNYGFTIEHKSGYIPKWARFPLSTTAECVAEYSGYQGTRADITVRYNPSFDEGKYTNVLAISGWYFCNGEG